MRLFALLVAGLLDAAAPHVRAESVALQALVADARERSATFRQIVDRLDRSDVIVYVRTQRFPLERLEGRIGFVSGAKGPIRGARVLLVELACARPLATQTATLAHELHHATEIADAPAVRDAATLGAYYRRIGEEAVALGEGIAFETRAARETSARVRHELDR